MGGSNQFTEANPKQSIRNLNIVLLSLIFSVFIYMYIYFQK